MILTEVQTPQDLWEAMTEPPAGLAALLADFPGEVLVLGGSGKMGKELVGLLLRCGRSAITVASTFSSPEDKTLLETTGATCLQGDLADPGFVTALPDAPVVIYMMGFKFGSGADWRRAFHLNSIVPYLIGRRFPSSRIAVFSSGNPYPQSDPAGPGVDEDKQLTPVGVYGWGIVAREASFATTALQSSKQQISVIRLMYAQHLCYGVLRDLCELIQADQRISLRMPAVNLISQRDANAAALRSLTLAANPPCIINLAGPAWPVRDISWRLAQRLGKQPIFADEEGADAALADDGRWRRQLGPYRDGPQEMIDAVAGWVSGGGESWGKPTYFAQADHQY